MNVNEESTVTVAEQLAEKVGYIVEGNSFYPYSIVAHAGGIRRDDFIGKLWNEAVQNLTELLELKKKQNANKRRTRK
jgi:hypothetical protein